MFGVLFKRAVPAITATVVAVVSVFALASCVFGADNQAVGDIAGNAANLGNSNVFTINSAQLSLVKTAFLTDGTPIASGTTVAKGTPVKFLIYMDNTTAVPVDSVNVRDSLSTAFVYQPGTLHVSSTVNSAGATPASIFAAANGTAALDDAVSNLDAAGLNGVTISAGASTGNQLVTVPGGKVWAVLFTVKVK